MKQVDKPRHQKASLKPADVETDGDATSEQSIARQGQIQYHSMRRDSREAARVRTRSLRKRVAQVAGFSVAARGWARCAMQRLLRPPREAKTGRLDANCVELLFRRRGSMDARQVRMRAIPVSLIGGVSWAHLLF